MGVDMTICYTAMPIDTSNPARYRGEIFYTHFENLYRSIKNGKFAESHLILIFSIC